MGRVPGHYCTAKVSYSSSPGEGSRRLQLCRASSQAWAHGSSSGSCSGHERWLHQAPTVPSPALQESREQLQTSGKLSSKALGAPRGQQLSGHPSQHSCAWPDPEIASLAHKLRISLHHTAVLLQQITSVHFSCGCFSTSAAAARTLTWLQCCGVYVHMAGSQDGAGDCAKPGFRPLVSPKRWGQPLHGAGEMLGCCYKTASENGFVLQWNYDSLDLLCRHPGSLPGWWIKWCWTAKSTKHQREWSRSHGTHFALWPQKCCIRASLWRVRQRGAVGSPAAPQWGQMAQPNRALSSLQYKPTCHKMILKNPLQT